MGEDARRYNQFGPENRQKLCEMIAASKVPGFDIVMDACGADEMGFGQSFTWKENLAAYKELLHKMSSKPGRNDPCPCGSGKKYKRSYHRMNAGLRNSSFFRKRIKYCNAFCSIFPDSDELIIHNFMRAEAESYASIDDFPTADRLFKELVELYPDNVWGYINWGDIYAFECHKPSNFEKAHDLYNLALSKTFNTLKKLNSKEFYGFSCNADPYPKLSCQMQLLLEFRSRIPGNEH